MQLTQLCSAGPPGQRSLGHFWAVKGHRAVVTVDPDVVRKYKYKVVVRNKHDNVVRKNITMLSGKTHNVVRKKYNNVVRKNIMFTQPITDNTSS